MKNAIYSGLRQALGIRFLLGAAMMAVMVFLSMAETLLRLFPLGRLLTYGYHTEFIIMALRAEALAPFIPILAVLPFAHSYVDDIKSRFARFFCIRSSCRIYLVSRVAVAFLSGGLVILMGILTAWFGAFLFFLPLEEAGEYNAETTEALLALCGTFFLMGGLWSLLGMTMSTLMESKYIACASPFVCYYLLVILHQRYFPELYILSPGEWVAPSLFWPYGAGGVSILLLELTAVFALVFSAAAERRLREL